MRKEIAKNRNRIWVGVNRGSNSHSHENVVASARLSRRLLFFCRFFKGGELQAERPAMGFWWGMHDAAHSAATSADRAEKQSSGGVETCPPRLHTLRFPFCRFPFRMAFQTMLSSGRLAGWLLQLAVAGGHRILGSLCNGLIHGTGRSWPRSCNDHHGCNNLIHTASNMRGAAVGERGSSPAAQTRGSAVRICTLLLVARRVGGLYAGSQKDMREELHFWSHHQAPRRNQQLRWLRPRKNRCYSFLS